MVGDGIGERGALTTTMDIGAAGAILIVRRITHIVDDRLCGPIVPATAATGAIVHPTTGRQTIRHRDPDAPEILPAVLRRGDQFRLAGLEHREDLRTPIQRSRRRIPRPSARASLRRRAGRIEIGPEQIGRRRPRVEVNRRVRISRQSNRVVLEYLSGPVRINRVQTSHAPVAQPHRAVTSRRVRINRQGSLRNLANHNNLVQTDLVQTNLIQLSRGAVVEPRRAAINRVVRISRQRSRQNRTRLLRRARTSRNPPLRQPPAKAMRRGEVGPTVNKAE